MLRGQYGAGRRRVYWERRSINGRIQEGIDLPVTIARAVITGVGIAVGFAIVRKLAMRTR